MRDPAFWWQAKGLAAAMLRPLSLVYGAIAGARMAQSGRSVGVPVICVGNLTVGGAGKTPTAIAVAQFLLAAGRRPFFLSRGYGGNILGPVQVDLGSHRAHEVGDEPLLLACVAPTIVARDRVAGADMARAAGADVIVMDDGFQNPSLAKNLNILVVDGLRGIGNGLVLPAGPLRAPLATQLKRAHALLVIGDGAAATPVVSAAQRRGIPVFHGSLVPDAKSLAALSAYKVFAFAGIGNPEKFFRTLIDARIDVQIRYAFPDHHTYRVADLMALTMRAERDGLVLVTTEKDFMRLKGEPDAAVLLNKLRVLPVALAVDQAGEFQKMVLGALMRA